MDKLNELRDKMSKKLKEKFMNAGIPDIWAENAARRVVELYENGMDFKEAVYTVYRGL